MASCALIYLIYIDIANHILKGINSLPLTTIVEVTFQCMVEYFNN